jgi:hypothetical protein
MAARDSKPLRLRGSQSGQVIVMFAAGLALVLEAAALLYVGLLQL